MTTTHIYRIQHWDKDENDDHPRPRLSRYRQPKYPWLAIGAMLRNPEINLIDYDPVRLVVKRRDAAQWHTYEPIAGPYPMLSETAVNLLKSYMPDFTFVEAWINERKFFFPRCMKRLDCLDRQHTECKIEPDDPNRIYDVERYAFFKDRIPDPLIFDIPEGRGLFATNSIKQIVEDSGLKGFYFYDAEVRLSWERTYSSTKGK